MQVNGLQEVIFAIVTPIRENTRSIKNYFIVRVVFFIQSHFLYNELDWT